jgi:signal transduction histidine kinase
MNTTKDRLFSIIGHDLKNPFTVLISLSQMIKDQLDHLDTEDLKKSLIVINNASNQGFALLDNLLDWARTQTGEIKFAPAQILLNESVAEVLNHIGPQSEKKQVQIKNTIKNTDVVTADRNMLQTILRNLISNAIKFSSPGGEVILEAELNQTIDKMVISVTDHGVGIPPENLSKLFNIKTHQSTKGTFEESGTGLGLLICKEFIEKHGGNIHVFSTVGAGTRITFDLPSDRR